MGALKLADTSLQLSVKRMQEQVATVKRDKRFSEQYAEEFRQSQIKSLTQTMADKRVRAEARAGELCRKAKAAYLADYDASHAFDVGVFRDYTAAAKTDDLKEIAKSAGDLEGEKALILAGELRRRGEHSLADGLCDRGYVSPEPWRESKEWKEAELILSDWERLDAQVQLKQALGTDTGETYVMTTDGAKPISALFL